MNTSPGRTISPLIWRRLSTGMIILHAALLGWGAVSNSVTFDEFVHLPSGIANWKTGDFSICCVSPPLVRLWAAWPVIVMGAESPPIAGLELVHPDSKHWVHARRFQNANRLRYHSFFVAGRFAMIPVSCLGAWLVWRWSFELFGAAAGFAACALYALCPNVLAHGSLVTTDVSISTAILASLYLWWRFLRRPDHQGSFIAALAISAAHLCKFTALFLWPIILVSAALVYWRGPRSGQTRVMQGVGIVAFGTLFSVNAMYGFCGTGRSIGTYTFESKACSALSRLPAWLPLPFPSDLMTGFDIQKKEAEGDYAALLLDEVYVGSKWNYYPVALACKLPLATLALISAAVAGGLWRIPKSRSHRTSVWFLLGSVATIGGGMVLLGRINIGVRYVLPMFPLMFILVASLWAHWSGWRKPFLICSLFLLAIESLAAAPRFLTFFNAAVGGSGRGYRIINDSNFDWGQGLMELKQWMDGRGVGRISLCYFGSVDPGVYGISYVPVTDGLAEPYVAVSSYFLAGLSHRLPLAERRTNLIRLAFNTELQTKQPVAIVADTIYIFRREDFAAASAEFAAKNPGKKQEVSP